MGGGVRLQVIETPGHSSDSLCYYLEEEGVLFTGDTLLGSSTTTVWDLGSYRRSLERLLELPNLEVICPGHGKIVNDPRERLEMYVSHRNMREQQILEVLEGGEQISSWDIMLRVYGDEIDTRLRRAADGNVRSHLTQLIDEGRINEHEGRPKRKRSERAMEHQHEHERERDRILREAKKIEAARSREEVRRQENPPSEQWSKPPLYELV